jgi:hypothetical protein
MRLSNTTTLAFLAFLTAVFAFADVSFYYDNDCQNFAVEDVVTLGGCSDYDPNRSSNVTSLDDNCSGKVAIILVLTLLSRS